jgi:dihydrolipoamide dehydrogenase
MVVGELATTVDVAVLGAGPGGYVAALRAAQLGKDVLVVDPRRPGGTCLHQGCIPLKALLTAARQYAQIPDLAQMGISVEATNLDWATMHRWKDKIIQRLDRGIAQLFNRRNILYIQGRGWFVNEYEILVEGEYGAQRFVFEQAVIAVGASPVPLPDQPFDEQQILTPASALKLQHLPPRLIIVGSDYIAAELADLFSKLGSRVDIHQPGQQQLLSNFEPQAVAYVKKNLKKQGVRIAAGKSLDHIYATGVPVVVTTGIQPNTQNLGLEKTGVETNNSGFIPVNNRMQTSNPTIYAVGDVTAGAMPLAHLAMKQGKVAAEHICQQPAQYAPQAVPRVVWTDPQLAAVGLSVKQATTAGYKVRTGRFPLAANGRALILNALSGFVLTIAEEETGVLLGVTIAGEHAETLIGEAALALEMGATLTDLAETLHPHPGLGEMMQEAAEAAMGTAVHIF